MWFLLLFGSSVTFVGCAWYVGASSRPQVLLASLVGVFISAYGLGQSVIHFMADERQHPPAYVEGNRWSILGPSMAAPLANSPYSLVERKAVVDVARTLTAYCHDEKNLDAARRSVLKLGHDLKTVYMYPELTPALSHPDMITAFGVCGRTLDSGMHIATSESENYL